MRYQNPTTFGFHRVEPTEANAETYAKAYAKLPRAERRKLDRAAKRALKRYRKPE
jgi:hypothetical protein